MRKCVFETQNIDLKFNQLLLRRSRRTKLDFLLQERPSDAVQDPGARRRLRNVRRRVPAVKELLLVSRKHSGLGGLQVHPANAKRRGTTHASHLSRAHPVGHQKSYLPRQALHAAG